MASYAEFPHGEVEKGYCKGGVDGPVYVRCKSASSARARLKEESYIQRYRSLRN